MANGTFGGGSGTTSSPYLVEDAADFEAVRKILAGHYKQTGHIDMTATANHVSIGTLASPFTGSYDGQNFEMRNLKMSGVPGYFGLFGHIGSPGTVRNLHVKNGNVSTTNTSAANNGTIVGYYNSSQNLENVSFQGIAKFLGIGYSGGIVGLVASTAKTIKAKFEGTLQINSGNYGGGIQGGTNGAVYDSQFIGSVSATGNNVGGIAGYAPVFDSVMDGEVIGAGSISGITNGTAQRCTMKGTKVQATVGTAYGISGQLATDCINRVTEVIGETAAAGVTADKAIRCINYSTVRGRTQAFGISAKGATDCANRGPLVTSIGDSAGVSGLYGQYDGNTSRCMCTANVETTGTSCAGITVGDYVSGTSFLVENSYFLGGHVKGSGSVTAKIGRISSIPRAGNKGNYSIDTSRIVLE